MLGREDARVAALHPSLPGLRVALDPTAVAGEVARALPALDIVDAEATYVRLKPPTSCLVGYRLTRGDGTGIEAYVRTASDADAAKLRKAVDAARRRAGHDAAAALLAPSTAVLIAPSDHELTAVVRLADPQQRRRVLERALDRPVHEGWRIEPLRYKPERRWVAVLAEPDSRRLLLKVHRSDQHRAAVAGARAFGRSVVPASRLVGSSRRHGVTVHQWIEGHVAASALADAANRAGVAAAVGDVLARVHAAEPNSPPLAPAPDEHAALAAGVATITALNPAAGIQAGRIAARLVRHLATDGSGCDTTSGGGRLLHGDCSVDQFVIGAEGAVLIDLDRATLGDPQADVGQLLADLTLRIVTGALAPDDGSAATFLDAYVAAGGRVDNRRLTAVTTARLLRLAPEPFRRRRENWAAELDAILGRADIMTRTGSLA